MTNFIKLNIEKEIKKNEDELQGFEWEEVYVNADNISHFKKVDSKLRPKKGKRILFADSKYKDDIESSYLEKYLLRSKEQDAFLKDEFSAFIQECQGSRVYSIFAGDVELLYNEAIEVYFKAGVHPLGSPSNEPVISCCGLKELEILVPQKNNKVE